MSNLTERRRIVFRHVDGEFYAVSRNGGSKHPGYLYLPQGASQTDENIIGTEDLGELARAALDENCAVRCKNLTTGAQHYLQFKVPSRFVWAAVRWPVQAATRCCGRDVRRVWRGDLKYRSA